MNGIKQWPELFIKMLFSSGMMEILKMEENTLMDMKKLGSESKIATMPKINGLFLKIY